MFQNRLGTPPRPNYDSPSLLVFPRFPRRSDATLATIQVPHTDSAQDRITVIVIIVAVEIGTKLPCAADVGRSVAAARCHMFDDITVICFRII
jgi:hypothetical protein